jgi:hypothetical protein
MKYENPTTYHPKDMANVKVFSDKQTGLKPPCMPPIFQYGGIKIWFSMYHEELLYKMSKNHMSNGGHTNLRIWQTHTSGYTRGGIMCLGVALVTLFAIYKLSLTLMLHGLFYTFC